MRFTKIEIKNFRQYQSLTLDFAKAGEHDLHIIVADNGVGKTNLLNAVTWCLYGEEPHLGNESKSLPRMNLNAKREANAREESYVQVEVSIFAEDEGEPIIYTRKTSFNANTDFEAKSELTVTAYQSGDAKIYTGEAAKLHIEKFMPEKIRQYFYFDSEQLDSYFITDKSATIKKTIHDISQVDIVTRVIERLGRVIAARQREAGKLDPKIRTLTEKLEAVEREIKNLTDGEGELQKQINISGGIIKTNTENLSGQENLPELEEKYQSLQKQKNILEKKLRDSQNSLFAFVREMKIALNFYPSARKTLELIREKEAQNVLPPNIDKDFLIRTWSSAEHCPICNALLEERGRAYIEELLQEMTLSSSASNILSFIRAELERAVAVAESYPHRKKEQLASYKDVRQQLKDCEDELQAIDNQVSAFKEKERVIAWHKERKEHQALLDANKKKLAVVEYQLSEARKQEQDIQASLRVAIGREKECARLNRQIEVATAALAAVMNIEAEMMSEVREKMEKRIMDYFSSLIWKKGVYKNITLNDEYQLDLFHRDGYSCVGSCSAAERSLLALSFTLALHEVSGFQSLLFIDTPVSRVTGQNRVNFANVLHDVSKGKQLLMAFTPDEYSKSVENILQPAAATSIRLTMNEDSEITTIQL